MMEDIVERALAHREGDTFYLEYLLSKEEYSQLKERLKGALREAVLRDRVALVEKFREKGKVYIRNVGDIGTSVEAARENQVAAMAYAHVVAILLEEP